MKKSKKILMTMLSSMTILGMVSGCATQGPKGDKGEQGAAGLNGFDGKDGKDGKDGSHKFIQDQAPLLTLLKAKKAIFISIQIQEICIVMAL